MGGTEDGGRAGTRTADGREADPDAGRPSRLPWRWFAGTFLLVLLVYGLSPVVTNGDSFLVAPTTASIVHDRDLDISESVGPGTAGGLAWVGDGTDGAPARGVEVSADPPDEPVYDYFPWTTALVAVPLYLVLLVPGAGLGISALDPRRMVSEGDAGLFNLVGGSVLTALMVAVVAATVWEALAGRVDDRTRRRAVVLTAAVVALGTSAWSVLSRALWSQSTATLLLALAFYAAVRIDRAGSDEPGPRRWAGALGLATAVAYTARPTSAVAVVAFGTWLLLCHRRLVPAYVAAGAAVAACWVAVNLATWGTLQPPYFSADRAALEGRILEALPGNLIAPNRGLLVFSPVVVLAAAGAAMALRHRPRPPLAVTTVGLVVAHWVIVSGSGEDWWAGATYGPRFMADLVPALAYLAVPALAWLLVDRAHPVLRRGAATLAALSVLLHLPGAWSKPAHCWNLEPPRVDEDPSRVWDWTDLQALEPVRVLIDTGDPREAVFRRCDELLDTAEPTAGTSRLVEPPTEAS